LIIFRPKLIHIKLKQGERHVIFCQKYKYLYNGKEYHRLHRRLVLTLSICKLQPFSSFGTSTEDSMEYDPGFFSHCSILLLREFYFIPDLFNCTACYKQLRGSYEKGKNLRFFPVISTEYWQVMSFPPSAQSGVGLPQAGKIVTPRISQVASLSYFTNEWQK
jgi:hypothetical protein